MVASIKNALKFVPRYSMKTEVRLARHRKT